uniref:Uncharacterized protein n=1 Tax=Oryza barthii TaxID=65489 RepID=A0A0D3GEM5_9ORYZ
MAKSGFSSGDAERGLRGRGGGRERTSARVRGTGGDSAAVADGDGNRHRGVAGKGGGSLYEGRKGLERLRECGTRVVRAPSRPPRAPRRRSGRSAAPPCPWTTTGANTRPAPRWRAWAPRRSPRATACAWRRAGGSGDWKVLEAAARVLAIPRAEAGAVDAVLNC